MSVAKGRAAIGTATAEPQRRAEPRAAVPHTHIHDRLRRTLEGIQDVVVTLLLLVLVGVAVQALWGLGRMTFVDRASAPVVLSQVVFILILTELYRTLIFYLREHRVSVALMLEVAMVSVLQNLILREAHEFEWQRVVVSSLLLAILGGLLFLERWQPQNDQCAPDASAH